MKKLSRTVRLLEKLAMGEEFTTSQLRNAWKFANPHDPIYRLRQRGYPIYSNVRTLSDGREVIRYRMGTPKKGA